MRLAVIQLQVRPRERAATLQAALCAIDAVAERNPSPEIIILPFLLDTLSAMAGEAAFFERAPGQTAAAFGQRARSLGLYIAFGQAAARGKKPSLCNLLLDADGDARLIQLQHVYRPEHRERFALSDRRNTTETLFGRLAFLPGEDIIDTVAWDAVAADGAELVVSCGFRSRRAGSAAFDGDHDLIAAHARRHAIPCAVADLAVHPDDAHGESGTSAIFDSTGRTLAAAATGAEATLVVEVSPATSRAPASRPDALDPDGGA